MTEKVISTQKQKFSVEAGRTTGVSFLLLLPINTMYWVAV